MIKRVAIIFAVGFVLNATWELLQMPLYIVDVSRWHYWALCLRAGVWDALIITGVYCLIDTSSKKTRYVVSTILCLFIAIFIEQRALGEGKWAYSTLMPRMGGIGILPLIQLPFLAVISYTIAERFGYTKK